jgi:di/tricarboxylate transporter
MTWEAWTMLGLVALMAVALVRNIAGPDTILVGGMTVTMTLGLFSPDKFPSATRCVAEFGNEGLITIGVLFVVAEGLSRTGAMSRVMQPLLGLPQTVRGAQARMMLLVCALSAFLNNTPIVAIFIPVVRDWCSKTGIAPSKLFIPLSYAAILGGSCTLIGTSINLIVMGMVETSQFNGAALHDSVSIGMFTISWVGIPAAIAGIGLVVLLSNRLLPTRGGARRDFADARRYTVEMLVAPGSVIAGKTIEQAGLRNLPGAYLVEVERDDETIPAVGPEQVLHGHDRLIFAGVVESVVELQKIRGLVPATDQVFKLSEPRPNRRLIEAVVSPSCPMVGQTIREGRFRTVYDAAVIAVHRNGEQLMKKIGDIEMQAGDTLLLETHPQFSRRHRNRRDFLLVSTVEGSQPIRSERAITALLIMVAFVLAITFLDIKVVHAALLAAGLMVLTNCLSPAEARESIDWRVLVVIGAALVIGRALETSGAAMGVAGTVLGVLEPIGAHAVLCGIVALGMFFGSLIGPVGSAALVFPISVATASQLGSDPMPFVIGTMMAAAASFATPIAYQTNLMVYGAGGYRFIDYLRIGVIMNITIGAVTVIVTPLVWPFYMS